MADDNIQPPASGKRPWTASSRRVNSTGPEGRCGEVRGYHNRGDPWQEQRYSGD
jgi:hypothetical protein